MGIRTVDLSPEMREKYAPIPAKHHPTPRGKGAHSLRKAARLARTPRILSLMGTLPEGFRVCAYPAKMNGWERKYAERLMILKRKGEIIDWEFEPVEIELAPGCRYTPDFVVKYEGRFWFHEIKGKDRRGASARIDVYKIARDKFPQFCWLMLELKDGEWREKRLYDGSSRCDDDPLLGQSSRLSRKE